MEIDFSFYKAKGKSIYFPEKFIVCLGPWHIPSPSFDGICAQGFNFY